MRYRSCGGVQGFALYFDAGGLAAAEREARVAHLHHQRLAAKRAGGAHFDRLARHETEFTKTARDGIGITIGVHCDHNGGCMQGKIGKAHARLQIGIVLILYRTAPVPPLSWRFPRNTFMDAMLEVLREGAVARLRMRRPEVHNAFDDSLIAAMTEALQGLGEDASVRAVVLEGEGASFSAGADLNWMRGMAKMSEAENRDDSLALARLMRTLDELPKPTIARVQGAAFGGGVGLVACCDIAIGVPEAKFGLTESKLGLLPAVISPYVISAIGPRQARRYFATAEIFDAAEALRIGLLHQVVDTDALDAAVQRQVDLLLKAGPVASASAKQLVRAVCAHADGAKHDADNAALIARLRVSPEGQEGLTAFLDKRKPNWMSA